MSKHFNGKMMGPKRLDDKFVPEPVEREARMAHDSPARCILAETSTFYQM